jgi:DNA-binding transcriptional LysR family regulator
MIPRLAAFIEQHPGITLDLVLDDRRIDLIEEGVDLAIRAGDLGDSTLVARRIDRAQWMLVASPAYLAHHGTPQVPGDLAGHRIASYVAFESLAIWTFTRGSDRQSVAVETPLRVNAAEGLRAAVLAGLGIGMVTDRMVGAELASGALVPLLPDWALSHSDIWVIFPEGRRVRQRARMFADWFEQSLRG